MWRAKLMLRTDGDVTERKSVEHIFYNVNQAAAVSMYLMFLPVDGVDVGADVT